MTSYGAVLKASRLVAVVNSEFSLSSDNIELCKSEFRKCIAFLSDKDNKYLLGLFESALVKVESL
jgi:hypothetical protein